jgi:hypothetical protein
VILQLATEQTLASFKSIDVLTRVLKVACLQAQEIRKLSQDDLNQNGSQSRNAQTTYSDERIKNTCAFVKLAFNLFKEYATISDIGRITVLCNANCIECLFDLFQEEYLRKHILEQVLALFRVSRIHPLFLYCSLYYCLDLKPLLFFLTISYLRHQHNTTQQRCYYAPNILRLSLVQKKRKRLLQNCQLIY